MSKRTPHIKPAAAIAKKQSKDSVVVSNKSEIDANNPVPFDTNGKAWSYTGVGSEAYTPFLGSDNLFANKLLSARLNSVTHNACIESKKKYIAGQGLYDYSDTKKEFHPEVTKWLKRMNKKGHDQVAISRIASSALQTFGNAPIEVVRTTVGKTNSVRVYACNFMEWRLGPVNEVGEITTAIYFKGFANNNNVLFDLQGAVVVPIFDPERPKDADNWKPNGKGGEHTVIWLKNDFDGFSNYGLPSSISSLIYQILEYQGARYNLDNFENNAVMGGIVHLAGNVTDAEINKIARNVNATHSGNGKRGRYAFLASEQDNIKGVAVENFDTHKDGSYIEFANSVKENIILSHEWSALLSGLSQANSLGKGNSFLRTEYNIKKSTVIDPAQEFLITHLWEPLFAICKNWMPGIDWDYQLAIMDIDPVSALSDIDPTTAIQVNEMRESLGLPADPTKIGVYMNETVKAAPKPEPDPKKDNNV